jgi:hypothetical protein
VRNALFYLSRVQKHARFFFVLAKVNGIVGGIVEEVGKKLLT